VLGSFLDAGAIDEVHVFVAPRLAGGAAALTPLGGRGVERIAEAMRLTGWEVEPIEGDLYIRGWR
jgi:diaminohydroxyphosphoribosylaminopyrimidine deaminase/5-amino-6-(5-phosphoribosylamino)uracil reductase